MVMTIMICYDIKIMINLHDHEDLRSKFIICNSAQHK